MENHYPEEGAQHDRIARTAAKILRRQDVHPGAWLSDHDARHVSLVCNAALDQIGSYRALTYLATKMVELGLNAYNPHGARHPSMERASRVFGEMTLSLLRCLLDDLEMEEMLSTGSGDGDAEHN